MKRIQRGAYGFRNFENYRLRVILLREASPDTVAHCG
jgi:hypothetical protein